jgi:thioredoxin-related protein
MSPQAIVPLFIASLLITSMATAGHSRFPVADDFNKLGAEAEDKQLPILLLISQYHCEYCDQMKREILHPMHANGDFRNRVLIRELVIDTGKKISDFQGNKMDAAAFSQRYGVYVTPTLLFLDSKGLEVAERISGINTIDYLAFYIQNAIETAVEKSFGGYKRSHISRKAKP